MTNSKKLPIYYIVQIKDTLEFWNIDTRAWLAQHALDDHAINDITRYIDYHTFESLLLSAVKISGRDSIGLYFGSRLGVNTHGMMGYAMLNSGSVREAIEIFQKFLNTRTPLISVQIFEHEHTLVIQFTDSFDISPIQQTYHEAVLLTLANILSYISLGKVQLINACFCYPEPHYGQQYDDFFHCEHLFCQDHTGLTLALAGIDEPLKMSDPNSLKQARLLCEDELSKVVGFSTREQKIREMLLLSVGHFPSLEQVAARFHISARTLHRHLKSEDTSYKEIVESVSSQLAMKYLQQSSISIQEISYLLGYQDVANFRRAFKRWYGVPPSELRK